MRLLEVLLLLAPVVACAADGSFLLPETLGQEMMKQCSRRTPTQIERFWMPEQKDIDLLEARLALFRATTRGGSDHLPISKYHRQYVGFTSGSARYIYADFYPAFEGSDIDEARMPVIICDGGKQVWGVVYSPQSGQFSQLEFNGEA